MHLNYPMYFIYLIICNVSYNVIMTARVFWNRLYYNEKKHFINQFFPLRDHGIGDQLYRIKRSSVGRVTIEGTHRDTPIAIRD